MMQTGTISGSIHKVYSNAPTDQYYKGSRMPRVGQTVTDDLGRKFVFVSTAVNAVAGQVLSARAASAELASKLTAASSGEDEVIVELAGVTANQYANGILVITASSGVKTSYSIKKNTAADDDNKATFTLDKPLLGDVAATDDCILVPNRFQLAVIGTALSDGVGVAIAPSTAGTTGYTNFFWAQVAGPGAVKVTTVTSVTKGVPLALDATGGVKIASAVIANFGTALNLAAVTAGDSIAAMLKFPGC